MRYRHQNTMWESVKNVSIHIDKSNRGNVRPTCEQNMARAVHSTLLPILLFCPNRLLSLVDHRSSWTEFVDDRELPRGAGIWGFSGETCWSLSSMRSLRGLRKYKRSCWECCEAWRILYGALQDQWQRGWLLVSQGDIKICERETRGLVMIRR